MGGVRSRNRLGWMRWPVGVLAYFVVSATVESYETVSPDTLLTMDRQTLETVQGKLDYLGPQTGLIYPITFVIDGPEVNRQLFQNAIPQESESLSRQPQPSFTVSIEELQTLIRNSQVSRDSASSAENAWLSFTVVAGQPNEVVGFEQRLDRDQAKRFFGELRETFRSRPAQSTFQWWGYALSLLPEGQATDVTDAVEIAVSRFQPDSASGHYVGQVSLRNSSTVTLPAPVSIVFNLSDGASVVEPDGTTCHVDPVGRAYVHAPLGNGDGLLSGESVKIPVMVETSEQQSVVFTIKVLAGPKSR